MRGQTVRSPEKVAEAQRLRAEGMAWREVGEALGVALSTAQEWGTDPDSSRRDTRRAKFALVCVECGGCVGGMDPGRMANPDEPVCRQCAAGHYAVWTREAIVCAIQEWADEHGGIPPTANDWWRARTRDPSGTCNPNHVIARFGSWNAGIQAAGFEPHAGGPLGGCTPLTSEQRAECARRYAAGESSTSIAADFGCSPLTVIKWARKAGVEIRPGFAKRAAA